jgi:hypothetical protein
VDEDGDGRFDSLEVTVGVQVDQEGIYGLTGELYRGSTFISSTYVESTLGSGAKQLTLNFSADDILAAQLDGPYTVQNIMLTDENDVTLLVEVADFVHTTAAYSVSDFGPSIGNAIFAPLVLRE